MPRTRDQCLSELCDLAKASEPAWESRVRDIVDEYLGEYSGDPASGRLELSDQFAIIAPDRERSARIRDLILTGARKAG